MFVNRNQSTLSKIFYIVPTIVILNWNWKKILPTSAQEVPEKKQNEIPSEIGIPMKTWEPDLKKETLFLFPFLVTK